uniref:uncharacterized protein si:ch211-180a12.2 n=1 Tax=Epinephelus lanceolatus TaxID=310571 RepID=UPI00144825C7|nr:uncharacterized protein si:ch211-180a12.2 [Epinephelus lanceolatus]
MRCKVLVHVVLLTLIKNVSPSEIQASPNTNAILPCNVTFPLSATGDKIEKSLIQVSWISNGSDIASFREGVPQIKPGFSWDTTDFVNGDFSLTVLRAALDLQGVYECTVSYNSTAVHSSNVTFSILASPTLSVPQQWMVLETESHLKCHADAFYPPPVFFSWTRDGQVIQPPYIVEGEQTPDGYYMAVGNLTFYPSREDQNATFGCKVSHNGSDRKLDFMLNITYLPSVRLSVVPSHSNNIPLTLYCDMENFYPEEVSVSWLQNGTVLPEPLATEQNPDGTYRSRRYYTLSPEQREQGGKVECAVNQPGVMHPVSGSAYLEKLDPRDEAPVLTKSAKASVAMMCISIVLVFLLCFGFSWRRRDEKQKSLNVSGIILPPRVIVGQKGRVTVSIEGRRVDRVQTAWFLNDTPISDTSLTVSEKGPLLSSRGQMGYYKLHTQGPLHSSGSGIQQLTSSLTFIPQISTHKGAVFKCQVSYVGKDKIVVERVSEKFTILSAPEVSEIQLAETPSDSDVISMTVRASHFHPDVITFRWFCQGSELSPVASQASSSPRPNSEGFFSAFSQCKLPRSELEKGGTKVWVSVHHIALKQPVTRETRGFIKRPCVSEIVGSTSSPDQTLTLGCEITDFYPPNVSVTWLRLREGEQDDREEEVLEGGEMWGPIQTQPGLYRATAILRRKAVNQEKKERGGIICRVEHCSLHEPMEKHWRYVDIAAPSIPPSLSVCWSSEGVGVFSVLLKGGHPKVKLLWAAGGHTLSPLVSNETEEIGDDGQRELKSVCALERSTNLPHQTNKQLERRKNGHAIKTKEAVTDPHTEGIEYIDEHVDGENNNIDRDEETKSDLDEDSDKERDEDPGALHINRVNLRKGPRENERARLRVCVEITHPALKLPVYRTWTVFVTSRGIMSDGQRDNTEEGLRMDEDSPMIGRVERTFWTVWSYITGAVNRFFRPEPTNITGNDPNSIQDSAVDSEPANCGHAEGDTSGGGVDEEQPVATAALLSSSRPLVAWEICTTEINLGPDEESVLCETQLGRGSESEASQEGEGTREEQSGRAGNDDAGVLFAQNDKREENGDEKLHTRRQDVMPENGETEEHANIRSLKTTGDAVSEDMEESRGGAEDTERAVTLDETIQVKEAEDKMQHEDEQDLQAEDSEVKLCLTADLTAVEEDNMHVEESKMQRNEADTAVMHEEVGNTDGVPQLASESESDEGARQVEHQLSACEESSEDHRDFKEDPGFSPLLVELQMTYDKSSIVSEDELTAVEQQHVMARRSESDEVEDTKEETDGSALDVSEAANNQTMDEAPEQEDDIKTLAGVIVSEHVTYREEAMQRSPEQEDDIKTVTEDILTEHVTCSEEVMQNAPQMEEEIKTVTEDIITEHVMSSGGFMQNALERDDDIETVTDDTLTEHVTRSEEFVQYLLEQEDDSLTEHVTGSGEFVQNAPELEEEIKTVTEDIITELLISSCEFVQNTLEQEDNIETVTEDILTEHVTCSEEVTQNAPEQEDDILTEHVTCNEEVTQNAPEQEDHILSEHVTCSEEVMQNFPEQDDDIKTDTEDDILTEHVTRSVEAMQNAPTQEDETKTLTEDILTEHVTCSEEVMQNFPEQDDDIKTDTEDDILTEHVTCSDEFVQNAPEQEDAIETLTEDTLTEHVTYGEEVMQHSLEQEDDIKAVTEDIIIEHVTCSEEFVQHAPEQEDDIITEHVTHSDEIMQNTPEQEDDILTEHVICSEEVTHHSPEQEDDIETLTADVLTERVTCSDDIMQNAPEQEDDIKAVTEDDILTEHVTHSEEFIQNAESELHTADFADVEQEDVAEDTEVQTKSREADDVETESHGSLIDTNSDITTHTSADESYFAQVEEESLSSEAVNKESDVEIACTATSVMDKPDGETGQEMSGEFKNIPQSMCEGCVVVSEELNSPTCEETREGVPEYNNEPDENTTQRFLEDEGYEEIQGSPLPEEVESKEPESLQNSGWSAGADCLLVREHMGEEQGVKNSFGLVVEDHAEILRLADAGMPQETETPLVETLIQGSGHLVEVEDRELLVDSMKTGIEEETEKESESDVESTNKDDRATEEPQDGTEELLVDLEKDEGLCDSKVAVAAGVGWETTGALAAQEVLEDDTFPEAEVQKMTETSYFQGLVDVMNSEQHLMSSLLDDITQSEFLKHSDETESVLLEDVEIQDAGYAVEMEAAADEMQGRNEMEIFHLQATEMAESELSGPVESLETKNQLSDEVLEISNEEMLPEAPGESMTAQSEPQDLILISTEDTTKHVTESGGSHAEETVSSISGRADVIDEEILDLWIQTASSEDNDGIQQQEGPEPGQQTEPSNEEQGEISSAQTEKDEEQLVDLVSDTEMSSSTVESGFLDQSLGEWGTQSNETQQPKSTSTESFQGIHEMLADISESSTQHSDFLMEETAETDLKQDESITATRFHPDSKVTSPEKEDLNEESDKSQEETEEERVEALETETGSQKEIDAEEAELAEKTDWKDTEEADVQSDKAETEDEPLEMSDSPDEIKHAESERSGSSSEASLEEGVVLTESGSQDDTCTESERLWMLPSLDEPQPRQSEDIAESEAGAEVAEQLTTKSEDEMEVDTFVLDFTVQRSRIAVKNPRVRPPKDPRSLLHMPSLDPTPSVPRPSKVPIGVPLGGMGIGIKLPGLGAGFPVLKKTQRVVRDENKPETPSEETKPEEKSDTPKQDEAPHRPKWMPPKHPGFGNPLMSELKSKLKKTTKE